MQRKGHISIRVRREPSKKSANYAPFALFRLLISRPKKRIHTLSRSRNWLRFETTHGLIRWCSWPRTQAAMMPTVSVRLCSRPAELPLRFVSRRTSLSFSFLLYISLLSVSPLRATNLYSGRFSKCSKGLPSNNHDRAITILGAAPGAQHPPARLLQPRCRPGKLSVRQSVTNLLGNHIRQHCLQ